MVLQAVIAGDLCDKSEGFDAIRFANCGVFVSGQNGSDSRTNGRVRIKRNEGIEKQKRIAKSRECAVQMEQSIELCKGN